MDLTSVSLVLGAVVTVAALLLLFIGKQPAKTSLLVLLAGFLFVGMSQWSSISISAEGFEIELETLRREVETTRQTAAEVADGAVAAATLAETTHEQLLELSTRLRTDQVMTAPAFSRFIDSVRVTPQVDPAALRRAAERLRVPLNQVQVR